MKYPLFLINALVLAYFLGSSIGVHAQNDYYFPENTRFDRSIPSPAEFLGYEIGEYHTRYDRIVAYLERLAQVSEYAKLITLGYTHEHRPLVLLCITSPENQKNLEAIRQAHLERSNPKAKGGLRMELPVIINLGYGVHGNEASASEAAMLTAYYLLAATTEDAQRYREESIIFIDPTLNPDGRDRHTHWANMHRAQPFVADPLDREHNEGWPNGRTNHYWFDLNRDWLLGIHPELQNKLDWYHNWLPNVVTDFHEMGTGSTYFFEPMKAIGTADPLIPKENSETLNGLFETYFAEALDEIGSLYFTSELFDGTYPGYGSSYPDLQGGLGLLFEQASSRGHVQNTATIPLTFAFTIRNQLRSSLATLKASVEEKEALFRYQRNFFTQAAEAGRKAEVQGYVFGDAHDPVRTQAFVEILLRHNIVCHRLTEPLYANGQDFQAATAYVVPAAQAQYRMVQTMFESYDTYSDSVFYDASAWSLVHAYDMPYAAVKTLPKVEAQALEEPPQHTVNTVEKSNYAYLIDWRNYQATKALYFLQSRGVKVKVAFKPFETKEKAYPYGTLMIPVQQQRLNAESLHALLETLQQEVPIAIEPLATGLSFKGVDLGSNNFRNISFPKACLLVGIGVSAYEAGEVWHLLDTRVGMPITKVDISQTNRLSLFQYNTLVMVSGDYSQLSSDFRDKLRFWLSEGNTLILIGSASRWAIEQRWVNEQLAQKERKLEFDLEEEGAKRKDYVQAPEIRGAQQIGGAIFEVDIDLTHPIGFGYTGKRHPVYKNRSLFLQSSKNPYSTVAQYTMNPLISGYISAENLEMLKGKASVLVSAAGRGRAVLFSDNPNFRGTWYGTNKMFFNALFFGSQIRIPE